MLDEAEEGGSVDEAEGQLAQERKIDKLFLDLHLGDARLHDCARNGKGDKRDESDNTDCPREANFTLQRVEDDRIDDTTYG